jgi:hypothetical protein
VTDNGWKVIDSVLAVQPQGSLYERRSKPNENNRISPAKCRRKSPLNNIFPSKTVVEVEVEIGDVGDEREATPNEVEGLEVQALQRTNRRRRVTGRRKRRNQRKMQKGLLLLPLQLLQRRPGRMITSVGFVPNQ